MEHDMESIARRFRIRGEPSEITPVPTGHIHDTYVLTTKEAGRTIRYVLQRINHTVFPDPPRMMENIVRITGHIRHRLWENDPTLAHRQLEVIATQDGQGYCQDAAGSFWRMYNFIEDAATYDMLTSAPAAYEAARMFGWFQKMLLDLPAPPLHETIPGFHDTPRRLAAFEEALRTDPCNRAGGAKPEIDFIFANAALCHVLTGLVTASEIPVRIAHNDAKINNVMLDTATGEGVCVIDLDTVMPGLSIHDFGDLVRTATCPAAEDERHLSKVAVDASLFDALARGFAQGTSGFLTPAEKSHLVFGGKLITFEQLIRFLTDYLAGDVYYKVHRKEHNLDRARTQMKLVQSIIEQEESLNGRVKRAFQNSPASANERDNL
jgi:hypothetical protein